ncbi:MAG: metal-dependent hydrolase [Dehalococcoidia bacterium]
MGVVLAWDKGLSRRVPFIHREEQGESSTPGRLAAMGNSIDYRLVGLGAMLPDIIDKPLGIYIFGDAISNGRIFGHTLVFFLILLAIGIYRYRRYARPGFLIVSLCSGFHLLLDRMWYTSHTLLWPAYGISFEKVDVTGWLSEISDKFLSSPGAYGTEIIGLLILLPFAFKLLRDREVIRFIKSGTI